MKHFRLFWILAVLPCITWAQERDPTVPPAPLHGAEQTPSAGGDPLKSLPLADKGIAIVVRDDKPYLQIGFMAYAPGQKVGGYTLEKISESEVWLRQGKTLNKIQIFNGVERRIATERASP